MEAENEMEKASRRRKDESLFEQGTCSLPSKDDFRC